MWVPEEPDPAPTRPARRLPPLQWQQERAREKAAVKKWKVLQPPTYEWERYEREDGVIWWAMIMYAPDTPHALVYCMENPRAWGTGLAYCESCRSSECSGCAWAWAAFKFGRAVDVPAIDDGLAF